MATYSTSPVLHSPTQISLQSLQQWGICNSPWNWKSFLLNSPAEIYSEENFGGYCGFWCFFFKSQKCSLACSLSQFFTKINRKNIYTICTHDRCRDVYARDRMEHIRNEGLTFTALPPDSVLSRAHIPLINFPSPNFKLHQGTACQHKPFIGFEFINIKSYWICRPQGSRLHSIYTHGQILTSTLTASNYSMFAGISNFSVYIRVCEVKTAYKRGRMNGLL